MRKDLENMQIINNVNNYFNEIGTPVILKHIGYLLMVAFSITGLSIKSSIILVFLMFLDIVTGIIRAHTLNGTGSITSKNFSRGIVSKLLLLLVPIVLSLCGVALGVEVYIIASSALNVFILSEAYSILGNIHSIKTKQVKHEFDAVGWALGRINGFLEKYLEDITKKNEK